MEGSQFWELLAHSELIPLPQLQSLRQEMNSAGAAEEDASALASRLEAGGQLTPFQIEILLAGHPGPFRYGPYLLQQRVSEGPLEGCFVARHRRYGFPAWLQFLPGNEPSDLERWKRVQERCAALSGHKMLGLNAIYETVVLPEHRLVASEVLPGKSLYERLPAKARMPWKQVCAIVSQVAEGVSALHQRGLVHGNLTTRSVWLDSSGNANLRFDPLVEPPAEATPAVDLKRLQALMVRMISGRDRLKDGSELERFELTPAFTKLLKQLGRPSLEGCPDAGTVAEQLWEFSGKTSPRTRESEPVQQVREIVTTLQQVVPGTATAQVAAAPRIDTGEQESSLSPATAVSLPMEIASGDPDKLASTRLGNRRSKRQRTTIAMLVGILLFAGGLGGGAFWLSGFSRTVADGGDGDTQADAGAGDAPLVPKVEGDPVTTAITQVLMDDDDQSLWETPTVGFPLELLHLPAAPRLILDIQGAALAQEAESARILQGLGPGFGGVLDELNDRSGFSLGDAERLTVSFHQDESPEFQVFGQLSLSSPQPLEDLLERWQQPELRTSPDGQDYFVRDNGWAYMVLDGSPDGQDADFGAAASEATSDAGEANEPAAKLEVRKFAFGSTEAIEALSVMPEGVPLGGTMAKLVPFTDQDRHFNLLFLRPALFNDRGQNWMGGQLQPFNRELSVLLPDEVRGGVLSFHFDEATYLELTLERSADLPALELREQMDQELRTQRDRLSEFVATIPSSSYWDRVRSKYALMLADLTRQFRWGVDRGQVVGNCWLPPMAAHNLVAASELVTAFAGGAEAAAEPRQDVPQTLEELLATPRDLEIANPPDLNVLMADLKTEIESDYGKLPFSWDIRLLGGDLEKDGITKNQRPGELLMQQKTLSEILTEIMISANPSKDITGPEDPECKLVWVLAEDPDRPGQQAILITTRAAAAEKSYQLPAPFREK